MIASWPCGHRRTAENTQKTGKAGERCRTCRREIANRSYRRKVDGIPPRVQNYWPIAAEANFPVESGWRDMAEMGSQRLLAMMLRYYERHHPEALSRSIAA